MTDDDIARELIESAGISYPPQKGNAMTPPRPSIKEQDIVVRKDTDQPRGIVVLPLFTIGDRDLRGLAWAPVRPGWHALVMWPGRKRLVAERAEDLTVVANLDADL